MSDSSLISAKSFFCLHREKNIFFWPFSIDAQHQCFIRYPGGEGCVCRDHIFTTIIQPYVVALVSSLLFFSSPAAIFRGIVTVIIQSVNLVVGGWFGSHVGEKGPKIVKPSPTNFDTPPAVVRKSFTLGVVASRFHRTPRLIFGQISSAMRGVGYNPVLVVVAPTGDGLALTEVPRANASFGATFTMAKETNPFFAVVTGENTPASKFLSAQVDQFRALFLFS